VYILWLTDNSSNTYRDYRQNQPKWQNTENNDDLTALDFHPSKPNYLLAGGDDGLVSIFDVAIPEEDDSLLQVVNHGPIHKAGFLDEDVIYALSSDQNLSIHPLTTEDTTHDDPAPVLLGDLRSAIPCNYVIDICRSRSGAFVAAGTHLS